MKMAPATERGASGVRWRRGGRSLRPLALPSSGRTGCLARQAASCCDVSKASRAAKRVLSAAVDASAGTPDTLARPTAAAAARAAAAAAAATVAADSPRIELRGESIMNGSNAASLGAAWREGLEGRASSGSRSVWWWRLLRPACDEVTLLVSLSGVGWCTLLLRRLPCSPPALGAAAPASPTASGGSPPTAAAAPSPASPASAASMAPRCAREALERPGACSAPPMSSSSGTSPPPSPSRSAARFAGASLAPR